MSKSTRDTSTRDQFLRLLVDAGFKVDADVVIARDNIYRINESSLLLVRTSRFHDRRHVYFFGLTRHIFENFAAIPGSSVAFVMADTSDYLIVPSAWLWNERAKLSADHKQYKLEITDDFQLKAPNGRRAIDLRPYRNNLQCLQPALPSKDNEDSTRCHTELQGMLIEIGNIRGYQTFCPNKSPKFKGKSLGELSTIQSLPAFPGINGDIVRQIDVVWLERSFPVHAFEVELTTGIWSGLIRLAELRRLNTVLHIVTDTDGRTFQRRISGDIFSEIVRRCYHATADDIRTLFDLERQLTSLRNQLALEDA